MFWMSARSYRRRTGTSSRSPFSSRGLSACASQRISSGSGMLSAAPGVQEKDDVRTRASVQVAADVRLHECSLRENRTEPASGDAARSAALTDNQVAFLQGPALALPMVMAAIPLGLAIDRCKRVPLLTAFVVLVCVGSATTAIAPSFETLFAARCLVGLSAAAVATTSISMMADLYQPTHRGRAKSVLVVGQYAGASAAFVVGGYMLAQSHDASWRHAMGWMTLPLIAGLLAAALMREPPGRSMRAGGTSVQQTLQDLRDHRGVVLPLLIGLVMIEVPLFGVLAWAAPTLSRTHLLRPEVVGNIMATVVLVAGIAGPVVGGLLADLCHRQPDRR